MREFYPGYYRSKEVELSELWEKATFIFDTNTLLDLYRFSQKTRNEYLSLLNELSSRIWIPYHVGFEYQENRLSVISDQKKRYDKAFQFLDESIKNLEEGFAKLGFKKSHSPIDPLPLIEKTKSIFSDFQKELSKLSDVQPAITDNDDIRDQLDIIIGNKIGFPPESQDKLDKIFESGQKRYEKKIPPGYEDASKGKSSELSINNGLIYKREFGDFVIWSQILENFSNDQNTEHVIFITSDNKEDWWWIYNGRTIGPRHELVEEILDKTHIKQFHMYNAEQFLLYAKEYLMANISQESIDQVREIRLQKLPNRHLGIVSKLHQVIEMFYSTLISEESANVIYQDAVFPDIIVEQKEIGLRHGYDFKILPKNSIAFVVDRFIEMARKRRENSDLDIVSLVFISENRELQFQTKKKIRQFESFEEESIFVEVWYAKFDKNNTLIGLEH